MTSVETAPIKVTILKPSNAQESEAYIDFLNLKHAHLIYAPETFNPELYPDALAEIQSFIKRYPSCRYSEFAQLVTTYAEFQNIQKQNDKKTQKLLETCEKLANKKEWPKGFRIKAKTICNLIAGD